MWCFEVDRYNNIHTLQLQPLILILIPVWYKYDKLYIDEKVSLTLPMNNMIQLQTYIILSHNNDHHETVQRVNYYTLYTLYINVYKLLLRRTDSEGDGFPGTTLRLRDQIAP